MDKHKQEETQINIKSISLDTVKNSCKQFSEAINDINSVINEKDSLTILMAFSDDPIGIIKPFLQIIYQVSKDIEEVNKQISVRRKAISATEETSEKNEKYKAEMLLIDKNIELIKELRK